MARVKKIRFNKAFEDIRRSPEVEEALQAIVDEVLDKVEDHEAQYAGGVQPAKSRSRGYVVTANGRAIEVESEEHRLVRALGSVSNG